MEQSVTTHEKSSAVEIEAAFLAGVEPNLEGAKGRRLTGAWWTRETRSQEYRLRQWVQSRDELKWLPKNKTVKLTGWRRTFWLGKKPSSIAIASVLALLERHAKGEDEPPPIGLADLVAHVSQLVDQAKAPHLIGVCSPSGFTDEARSSGVALPNVTLVLIEPDARGGWRVTPGGPNVSKDDLQLFDPESVDRKVKRVADAIDERSAELVTGGLRDATLARELDVSSQVVQAAMKEATNRDAALKISKTREGWMLYRGVPSETEDASMSMSDRLKQLLGQSGEAKKINVLSERRARLIDKRDRLYGDIAQLEEKESALIKQGRDSASPSAKKRAASQIKHLRDEMSRIHAKAKMLGQQVDVISTHVHNLTLIQQGKSAKLPTHEELTHDAVRAEEMLEQLNADSDLAVGLGVGADDTGLSDEEEAILAELASPQIGDDVEAASNEDAVAHDKADESLERKQRDSSQSEPREPEAG